MNNNNNNDDDDNKQTNNIYNPPQDSAPGTYREYKKPIFALVLAR
jgi:hypothetical protein